MNRDPKVSKMAKDKKNINDRTIADLQPQVRRVNVQNVHQY
jgi:hypothetical protein